VAAALVSACALALVAAPARAQHPLVSLPLDDPAYEQLAGLDRQGCAPARVSSFRPYLARDVRRALRRAAGDSACRGILLDALSLRFTVARLEPVQVVRDTLAPDTLAGVAPDLARAIREAERRDEPGDESRLSFGGKGTLVATVLSEGDFEPRWLDVRPTSDGTPPLVAQVRGRATWDGGPRMVAVMEGFAQSHARNDQTLRARALRRTSGAVGFSEAYLSGSVGNFVLSFGRAHEAWLGRGRESLVLGAHGPPLDRLVASISTRRFEARALAATLDDVVLDTVRGEVPSGVPPQRFYRVLVGHTIVWRPFGALELSAGETAVLSRGSRTLDAAYLNPLMLYIVTQNDTGRESNRDNLTAFGAARVRLGPATITGELMVDDIQIDKADRARTPDQLGWRVEATSRLPLIRPASATLEYRRLDSYTYMRGDYDAVYQHFDRPLGSELGPDADDLRVGGEVWATGGLRFAATVGRWRRGTLRVYERPGQRATGNAGRPFPTTAPGQYVQSATTGDLVAQLLSGRVPLTARLGLARIENVNNTLAASALYVRAQLTGSYAFRYP
jgi:hypothetical protein